MNHIFIYSITILGALLCLISIENKKLPVNRLFQSIRYAYVNLMKCTSKVGVWLVKLAIGIAFVLVGVFSFQRSQILTSGSITTRTLLLMCCIFTILIILLYFLFGCPLLIFSKIENLIQTIHKRRLSFRFLVTSYILFVYSFFLWYAPRAMAECGKVVLVGLLISYCMNMVMLINISMEPLTCCCCKYGQKARVEQKYPLKIVLAGAIILILLIVLNLYLCVVMIANLYEQAYVFVGVARELTYFDLLYYTVISFTTIGYGEIVPQRIESKVMAIVIAYTSVMCLVIFVSSILALKDKLESGA